MRTLVKSLLRYDKPLLLNISDPRELNDLRDVALEFPTHRFIILHMAGEYWPMAVALAAKHTNVSLETGGSVVDFDKLAEALAAMGGNRLLFGSGMPFVNPVYALGMIRDSAIPPVEKERILAKNARRTFNLE
jgi:predicted TIM-barrel fold metal-dependent hydrolase